MGPIVQNPPGDLLAFPPARPLFGASNDHGKDAAPSPMSLSQTVRSVQRQVSANMALAQQNPVLGPQVQRLVGTYEAWENKLRNEAQLRLANGLAPPTDLRSALVKWGRGDARRAASATVPTCLCRPWAHDPPCMRTG